jgi:hypothetical protein
MKNNFLYKNGKCLVCSQHFIRGFKGFDLFEKLELEAPEGKLKPLCDNCFESYYEMLSEDGIISYEFRKVYSTSDLYLDELEELYERILQQMK